MDNSMDNSNDTFKEKYFKYKIKYINLKNQLAGTKPNGVFKDISVILDQKNRRKYAPTVNYTVIIPNNVTEIKHSTFRNFNLVSVIIGNSVNMIGQEAFAGNELTEIIIPKSVTHIGKYAFINNKLTKVTMPKIFKGRKDIFDESKSWLGDITFTYI